MASGAEQQRSGNRPAKPPRVPGPPSPVPGPRPRSPVPSPQSPVPSPRSLVPFARIRAMKTLFRFFFILLLTPGLAYAQRGGGQQGPQQATTPEPLKFRYMGPAPAGRIASVAGVPGDPKTWYLGSASGGVWKSTDGGTTFTPIFDDQPVAAIGSIAVAPPDPRTVWGDRNR